jgi:MFS family permease
MENTAPQGQIEPPPRASAGLNRNRDFLKLWAGETVSAFGTYIGDVSISFAAVIALGATPLQMGLLTMATNLPALLFSLFTGVWVDRVRRRALMIACDVGRFVLLASIPLAAIAGILRMQQLYAVILCASLLDLIFGVAYQAYLPTLVTSEQLLAANSRLTASSSVAMVSGWSLAGWIVEWVGAPFAVGIDAVSFLASAAAIVSIDKPESASQPEGKTASVIGEMLEGARFLLVEPRVRGIGVATLVNGLASGLLSAIFVLYLVDSLGFKTGPLGFMFAAGGASAFVGSLLAQRVSTRFGMGPVMVFTFAMNAVGIGVIALAYGPTVRSAGLIVAQQILGGLGLTIYSITAISVVQVLTPQAMMGRVMASFRFIFTASLMVGAPLAGFTSAAFGIRATIVAGSLVLFAAATVLAFSPAARIRDAAELTNGALGVPAEEPAIKDQNEPAGSEETALVGKQK